MNPQIAEHIEKIIFAIGNERKKLEELAKNKALSEAEYDKARAVTMAKLSGGEKLPLEGQLIESKTATNLKQKAEGVCYNELYEKIYADCAYRNCITNIECLRSQLNGYQSIYKGQIEI